MLGMLGPGELGLFGMPPGKLGGEFPGALGEDPPGNDGGAFPGKFGFPPGMRGLLGMLGKFGLLPGKLEPPGLFRWPGGPGG